jgi:hypothetical protein
MIKIPIMGIPFTITFPVKVDKKDNHVGESDGTERTIKVKKSLTDDVKRSTLLHEILHSILYVTGQAENLTEKQEEAIVLALEHGLDPLVTLKEEYIGKS